MVESATRDSARELIGGAMIIVLCGAALGVVFNWFGLISEHPWGLSWIGQDRLAMLAQTEVVGSDWPDTTGEELTGGGSWTDIDDPLAVPPGAPESAGLPEIPDAGRPVQIELGALKKYFDAEAAVIVDARDPEDYAEGHIEGAINLPYHAAVTDPASLETLDTRGMPIITYCGGGTCEVSLTVAEELFYAGHNRIAVYIGGFSEWAEAGYPVGRRQ
jgi:rhodanese-related sulfurtransferase